MAKGHIIKPRNGAFGEAIVFKHNSDKDNFKKHHKESFLVMLCDKLCPLCVKKFLSKSIPQTGGIPFTLGDRFNSSHGPSSL